MTFCAWFCKKFIPQFIKYISNLHTIFQACCHLQDVVFGHSSLTSKNPSLNLGTIIVKVSHKSSTSKLSLKKSRKCSKGLGTVGAQKHYGY